MCSSGINGEGELMGQPAKPGSPGKMAVKMVCVCVYSFAFIILSAEMSWLRRIAGISRR